MSPKKSSRKTPSKSPKTSKLASDQSPRPQELSNDAPVASLEQTTTNGTGSRFDSANVASPSDSPSGQVNDFGALNRHAMSMEATGMPSLVPPQDAGMARVHAAHGSRKAAADATHPFQSNKRRSSIPGLSGESHSADEITNGVRQDIISNDESNTTPVPSIETAKGQTNDHSTSPGKRAAPTDGFDDQSSLCKKAKYPTAPGQTEAPVSPRFPSPPEERASPHDKEKWEGWCEIESDPAYISAMFRMMGVKGVSVREPFSIDIEEWKKLPQPVYGLIFLFRYREDEIAFPLDETNSDSVWFANQLPAQNSCATLAMFNILMNTPAVKLGEHLEQFNEFTTDFTPYARGEAFASFRFVKQIHNSFAKKMDMLEADQTLANNWEANKHSKKRRGSRDSIATGTSDTFSEENAHHFIAFLPIDGHVWKLDGLSYQPTNLGAYDTKDPDSWMAVAADRMAMLMAASGDMNYTLLSVVQSPVVALRKQLATSHASIERIESRLGLVNADWRSFLLTDEADSLPEPLSPSLLESLGIGPEELAAAAEPAAEKQNIETEGMEWLLARRGALIKEQFDCQSQLLAEMETESEEDEKAKQRQWDYGPLIHRWLELLAESGYLEENLHRFQNK